MSVGGNRIDRPIPVIEPPATEYWEGARRGELVIQHCDECRFWVHPPRFGCPHCGNETLTARPVSGRGTIYSFSIMHMGGIPGFEPPYGVAVIELDEQPGLITVGNVLDCPVEELEIGTKVEVVFEKLTDKVTLPQWSRVP